MAGHAPRRRNCTTLPFTGPLLANSDCLLATHALAGVQQCVEPQTGQRKGIDTSGSVSNVTISVSKPVKMGFLVRGHFVRIAVMCTHWFNYDCWPILAGGGTVRLVSSARRKNCLAKFSNSRRLNSSDSLRARACNSAAFVR